MAIYHLSVQMISRGSGRSAVGASAYRSGEKLRSNSLSASAYRSGEELRDEDGEIVNVNSTAPHSGVASHLRGQVDFSVFDYTKRSGVVHKEVILPENAPKEYRDRQTLWNVVEKREKRHDAQLAREINVALPTEFDLEEQKALLREYIRENFVDKGMIADFAIHHTRTENPHAHIMLTTRTVTPDGFGNKNREWNSRQSLVNWRENWADITNRMLERKGLEERIDHRTLKAQGIDREPTIHLGAEATALERQGIRTERGDYNREIKRRNAERAAKTEQKFAEKEANINNTCSAPKNNHGDTERNALMSAKRSMREIEKHLKTEKAKQTVEKLRQQREAREESEITIRMNKLNEEQKNLENELKIHKSENIQEQRDIPPLEYRAENIDEYNKHIRIKREKLAEWQETLHETHIWQIDKKRLAKGQIEQITWELEHAWEDFKKKYKIDPDQAQAEIERINKKVWEKESKIRNNEYRIMEITQRQEAIKTEYRHLERKQQVYRDKGEIDHLLKYLQRLPESDFDKHTIAHVEQTLTTVENDNFYKITRDLPCEEAQILTNIRENALERERLENLRRMKMERNRAIERSR